MQLEQIRVGFYSVIPPDLILSFTIDELRRSISGDIKIDVDDWEKFTIYTNCMPQDAHIINFWKVVKDMPQEELRLLYSFITASPNPPVGGFKCLFPPFNIHLGCNVSKLPTSTTCFNGLVLPPYETLDQMRHYITLAVENNKGFGLA